MPHGLVVISGRLKMKNVTRCTVGVIGTGLLGSAVAMHLVDSKYDVFVYNRTKSKTTKVRERGAIIVDTPAELARRCNVIIIIVSDASAVNDVAFGENGIIHGIHDNLIIGDMSTIGPLAARQITRKFQDIGVTKLDIPVMGGPNVAIDGKLTMIISGNKSVYYIIEDMLKVIANNHFFVGDDGSAQTIKLAMNMQITMLALSLSEGIMLTKSGGVDPKLFLDVLNSTYFGTGMSKKKAYKMISDLSDPTFTLANLTKDISIMCNTADALEIDLSMIQRAKEIYSAALLDGFGEIDYTGIIRYIEKKCLKEQHKDDL